MKPAIYGWRWDGCRPEFRLRGVQGHEKEERGIRGERTIVGVDLAKNVFQVHGAAADGTVLFRKKLTRPKFHRFMAEQLACLVAVEACGGAH
jgi:hypothetical protein